MAVGERPGAGEAVGRWWRRVLGWIRMVILAGWGVRTVRVRARDACFWLR